MQYNCADGRVDKADGIIEKYPNSESFERCFRYDKYYDAIIPLIQKQEADVKLRIARSFTKLANTMIFMQDLVDIMMATPSQLLNALLVATGKAEL